MNTVTLMQAVGNTFWSCLQTSGLHSRPTCGVSMSIPFLKLPRSEAFNTFSPEMIPPLLTNVAAASSLYSLCQTCPISFYPVGIMDLFDPFVKCALTVVPLSHTNDNLMTS